MQRLSFIIPGKPIAMRTETPSQLYTWNSTRQKRLKYKMAIIEQYEKQSRPNAKSDPEPIDGEVEIEVQFFLAPEPLKDLPLKNHKPHAQAPVLLDLERFVQNILTHLVFAKAAKITKINANKTYDDNPRTIIKLKIS